MDHQLTPSEDLKLHGTHYITSPGVCENCEQRKRMLYKTSLAPAYWICWKCNKEKKLPLMHA